jgi:hypothetical protein
MAKFFFQENILEVNTTMGQFFDFFSINLKPMIIYQKWVFDFVTTMVINRKNHPYTW